MRACACATSTLVPATQDFNQTYLMNGGSPNTHVNPALGDAGSTPDAKPSAMPASKTVTVLAPLRMCEKDPNSRCTKK